MLSKMTNHEQASNLRHLPTSMTDSWQAENAILINEFKDDVSQQARSRRREYLLGRMYGEDSRYCEPLAVGPSRAGMTLCKANAGLLRATVRAMRLDHLRLIPSS
jgi:hypothetical protein